MLPWIMDTHFEVPLPCGRRLLIDPTGFDKIKHLSWQSAPNKVVGGHYVVHGTREKRADGSWCNVYVRLARFLMGLEKGDPRVADHRNGNGLDNRWVNLRVCTGPQNVCNRKISKNNTSGFKGVSETKGGRFMAAIAFQQKTYYLGTFDTPEEAHQAYCEAAIRLHGEFANFGDVPPPPGPGIEVFLPSSIGFLRQHLPDPARHALVRADAGGNLCAAPFPANWSEHRPSFMNGPLSGDKLIYDRVLRRFRDLVANKVVAEEDQPTVVALLTAAEVGFDQARTTEVSCQKPPAVAQVFKNMRGAGLWREWEPGQGIRWGFKYGWKPEAVADREWFALELTSHVRVAEEGVAEALGEWRHGIGAARATIAETAKQKRLAEIKARQDYRPPPSRLCPTRPVQALSSGIRGGLRLIVANQKRPAI